jgi:hypothetical protein
MQGLLARLKAASTAGNPNRLFFGEKPIYFFAELDWFVYVIPYDGLLTECTPRLFWLFCLPSIKHLGCSA